MMKLNCANLTEAEAVRLAEMNQADANVESQETGRPVDSYFVLRLEDLPESYAPRYSVAGGRTFVVAWVDGEDAADSTEPPVFVL